MADHDDLDTSGTASQPPSAASAPAAWRLLAHPLRSRILAHLRLQGGATAADLARALGSNTGATSYHCRVLADAGLLVDTGLGDGRSRVWAAAVDEDDGGVDTSVAVSTISDADELADALWLAHDHVDHHTHRLHGWIDAQVSWPMVWQEECGLDEQEVLVDETQLAALRAELGAVLDRYRRRGAGTPGARRVTVAVGLTPLPRRA
ncbi:ArsR/SmtB family transcription factor [Janibacter alittae]|uniref:Winged helix-turn-helix domain-containing protein n=1 Tax=Janibacter alittae TaxID=3115209 RepID=A0ABZ2MJI6_9MICO